MYNILCLMRIYNNRRDSSHYNRRSLEILITPIINYNSSNIHASMHVNDTCHLYLILQIKIKCPCQLKMTITVITSRFWEMKISIAVTNFNRKPIQIIGKISVLIYECHLLHNLVLKVDTQDSATHPEFSFNPLYLPHIVEKWITKCLHPHVCSKFDWEKAEETKAEDCNMYYYFMENHMLI